MLLFGRTLHGTTLAAGPMLAAGVAVCTASAEADAHRLAVAIPEPVVVSSTAAPAPIEKVVTVEAVPAATQSGAEGAATVVFNLAGEVLATATLGEGAARVDFNAFGDILQRADADGHCVRVRRVRGERCFARAHPAADGENWTIPVPLRAIGRARLFGTTDYVGWGLDAVGQALVSNTDVRRSFRADPLAGGGTAQLSGDARADKQSSGRVRASATCLADPVVQLHDGTVLAHGNGTARCTATVSAEPFVYNIELAVGRAQVTGAAERYRVAASHVQCRALVSGVSELVIPLQGHVEVGALATGYANGQLSALGEGAVESAANTHGDAQVLFSASGQATATATCSEPEVWLRVHAEPALCEAQPTAWCVRTVLTAAEPALCSAEVTGFNQVNDVTYAPTDRTYVVPARAHRVVVGAQPRRIIVTAATRRLVA